MKVTKQQAALATILYADIFDYPLSLSELRLWCVGQKVVKVPSLNHIQTRDNFFFLSGRSSIVDYRNNRHQWAAHKWGVARRASQLLRLVPSIELIGVTGGLAMENAKEEDDIDLFFIVAPGTMWMTRFLAVVIMECFGMRRRPKTQEVKNTICLNMFMSSDALAVKERDLYTAHEVLQMTPLWEKVGIHKLFLQKNAWVKMFLPAAWEHRYLQKKHQKQAPASVWALKLFEPLAKYAQLWYMRNHMTTEVVSDTVLRFHPKDARVWVKKALSVRLSRYKIPLDKIFFGS